MKKALSSLLFTICFGLICQNAGIARQNADFEQALVYNQNKDWNRALRAYSELVRTNPYNGRFWFHLGEIQQHLKNYPESTEAYKKAVELGYEGGNNRIFYAIGQNYALQNNAEEAIVWLTKAIRGNLNFLKRRRLENDSKLNSIRKDQRFQELFGPKLSRNISRVEGWRADLRYMAKRMEAGHHNLFGKISREMWDAAVESLYRRIPSLQDSQINVELMKLAAMVGDGHTHASFRHSLMIPLRFYHFSDGFFIRAAAPTYKDAVGAKVLKIGQLPVEHALEKVRAVIPRDNEMTAKWVGPRYLASPEILQALSIIDRHDRVELTIENEVGMPIVIQVKPVSYSWQALAGRTAPSNWVTMRDSTQTPAPLWLKDPDNFHWFRYLDEKKIVYAQINHVLNKPNESLKAFSKRLFAFIDKSEAEALIIDIRLNNGGNLTLDRWLIHEIIRSEKINQKGRLFTIIGRRTFSAAVHLTAQLEMHTETIFVGEPISASPNFVGEDNHFLLPYSGIDVSASNRYWQSSFDFDDRIWIAPHIAAELSSNDFKSNVDPAMNAILLYLDKN